MSVGLRLLLGVLVACVARDAGAGAFYRCDDGSGVAIYQTVACSGTTHAIARHEYVDAAAVPPPRAPAATTRNAPRRARAASGRAARAPASPPFAYACSLGAERWIQTLPCASSGAARGAVPRERALSQEDVCRQVRDGSFRAARGESVSDSAYQRNLMRDRGC